jgi:FKBP-type peptidyl-prolyl cis-trans isomerase FkpA
MKLKFLFLFTLLLLFVACKEEPKKEINVDWTTQKSSDFSKDLAIEEDIDIKIFLQRKKDWKITETGSGLRYYIYQKGSGPLAESGMTAEVKFEITKLDGTICYKTEGLETETFKIDKSEIETGVQEGIKYMHIGDKIKLIIPSHLGHGLVGDFDKIPPLTTLVVDLELVSLRKS